MNSTLKKIGRWSGIIVVGIAILIVLFYAEENWRGARAWADTKKFWEAQGESFDFQRFIPPPVPPNQNLATLPLFKEEPDPSRKGARRPAISQQLHPELSYEKMPHAGSWQEGRLANGEKMRQRIASCYAEVFGGHGRATTSLDQFDALFPFVSDLHTAALTRPYWRFPGKYEVGMPNLDVYIRFATSSLSPVKFITLHGVLALEEKRPDIALDDFELNLRIIFGLTKDPFIISGLCAVSINAINMEIVWEGLQQHAWSDTQLSRVQADLGRLDFLASYWTAMHGECFGMSIPGFDQLKENRPRMKDIFAEARQMKKPTELTDILPDFWPDGWLDQNKAQIVWSQLYSAHLADPVRHLARGIEEQKQIDELARRAKGPAGIFPWNFFFLEGGGPARHALKAFAYAQVVVNQAFIACGLERYHLVHRVYPSTLDGLVPDYVAYLPIDAMSGQPFRYRPQPGGTFLLYSVGWNQQDEGGKIIHELDNPHAPDSKLGDWVWPTTPRA